jgi:predicted nucleic acid-binding Zn ribbon protein
MRRRVAQSKPEIIGAILRKVLKKRNIPHTSTDQRLIDLWTAAVGPQIAARTLPEAIKRGTLYVRVSSPVWLHQLQFLKEEILGKVNELSGREEIRSLHLSIGEVPSPAAGRAESSAAAPSSAPLLKRDREMMRESLAAVTDPELREILERVMFKEISRRREREMRKDR